VAERQPPASAASPAASSPPPEAEQPGAIRPGTKAAPHGQEQQAPPHHKLKRTRAGGTWAAISCFAVVLLVLLIFILQNSHSAEVSFSGVHGHLHLGVALLLAAVCGALLVIIAGTARIMQLRATARKHRRTDRNAAGSG
jgi:uncharacterized integral membrane protein